MQDFEHMLKIYEYMVLSREMDFFMEKMSEEGIIPGYIHMAAGHEAFQIGAFIDLRRDDFLVRTGRGYGEALAKGTSVKKLMAEACGRTGSLSDGRGGCVVNDAENHMYEVSSVLGGNIPATVGMGFAAKYNGTDQVACCVIGDGTANRELIPSSLHLAKLWNLPIIFMVCNNRYAAGTEYSRAHAYPHVADLAKPYGMYAVTIDGNDALVINDEVNAAIARARAGEGPSLIECMLYRQRPHAEGWPWYGADKLLDEAMAHDPIKIMRQHLKDAGATDELLDGVREKVLATLEEAKAYVLEQPMPSGSTLMDHLFE